MMKLRVRFQHDPPQYVPPHRRTFRRLSPCKNPWRTITIHGKTKKEIYKTACLVLVAQYGPGNVRVRFPV